LRSFAKKKDTKKALTKSRTSVATLSKSRSILRISSDLLRSTESNPFIKYPPFLLKSILNQLNEGKSCHNDKPDYEEVNLGKFSNHYVHRIPSFSDLPYNKARPIPKEI
jgi:hypothetical protein